MTNKCLFTKFVAGNGRSKLNVNLCDKDHRLITNKYMPMKFLYPFYISQSKFRYMYVHVLVRFHIVCEYETNQEQKWIKGQNRESTKGYSR